MTTSTSTPTPPAPPAGPPAVSLHHGTLPPWAPAATAVGAAAVAGAVGLVTHTSPYLLLALGIVVYAVAIVVLSTVVESRRRSTDRLVTTLVYTAFLLAMIPLVSLVWIVLSKGLPGLSVEFFTHSMRGVVSTGGGISHAIIGTLLITLLTAVISVPIGLMTAIYLVEYGRGRLARAITFLVDVMTGIPSIVAGLFAYALFELFYGPGIRMGAAGAVALSVLMVPIVVRSSEEMLKLVPNELREASYALGVPKWRTIVRVVVPTSIAGVATGVTLALARVVGETAPLLLVAGFTTTTNTDLVYGRMTTLPVFAYYQYVTPGVPPEAGYQRAWSAALVLIIIVMGLNLVARVIARLFAPRFGR